VVLGVCAVQIASQRLCLFRYWATRSSDSVFSPDVCAFLAPTSIKLIRGRHGTLQNAGWPLAPETVGAVSIEIA